MIIHDMNMMVPTLQTASSCRVPRAAANIDRHIYDISSLRARRYTRLSAEKLFTELACDLEHR